MYTLTMIFVFTFSTGITSTSITSNHPSLEICERVKQAQREALGSNGKVALATCIRAAL